MNTPTAIPTPQPPATPEPPPQRKYTVSPKVLAAARANLAKANAISKEVRYRPTPKRLIACRANLLKALVALKDDQRAWAPRFRLGNHTVSLRRSLVLAGESEAQYDAHRERFRRALAPRDTVERKLTGALADVCWRRLRILRLHSRREQERLRGLLRGAVTRRWAAAGTETLWDRTTAQTVLEAFAEGVPPLLAALERVHTRLERLVGAFVARREGRDPGKCALGRTPVWASIWRQSEAVLGNPFVAPARVEGVLVREIEGLLGRREPSVCDFRNWTWQVSGPSGETFEGEDDLAAGVARMDRLAASALPSAPPEVEAFHWGVSTNDVPVADAAREGETFQRNVSTEAVEAFAAHLRLMGAAFPLPKDETAGASPVACPELREVAALTWLHGLLFATQAETSAARLNGVLERAAESTTPWPPPFAPLRAGSDPGGELRADSSLAGGGESQADWWPAAGEESQTDSSRVPDCLWILLEFEKSDRIAVQVEGWLHDTLRGAFGRLLRQRYGEGPQFDAFRACEGLDPWLDWARQFLEEVSRAQQAPSDA